MIFYLVSFAIIVFLFSSLFICLFVQSFILGRRMIAFSQGIGDSFDMYENMYEIAWKLTILVNNLG